MKKNIFLFTMLFIIIVLINGCMKPDDPINTDSGSAVKLSALNGYFEVEDYKTYGIWYLKIDKCELQKHLPANALYHIRLNDTSFPIEQHKINENLLFALLPEGFENDTVKDALITTETTTERKNEEGQKRSLEYIILKKDTAENGTDLFRLSLSDYLQLKVDKTSFIYKNSVLIRPLYVISDEGSAYTLKRYLDARQTGLTKDVDGAFRFLNNLSNPDSYMFFGNPNKVRLKTGGHIEKDPPDTRQRLRTLGTCGDLTTGNFYQIEEDTTNNRYKVRINLNNTSAELSEKSFASLYLRGTTECFFSNTTDPDILQTIISFNDVCNSQMIKNARCFGFMFQLRDTSDTIKGYYESFQNAVDHSANDDRIIVGTRSVINPEQQTHIHDKTLLVQSENSQDFTLDYTSASTRCILLTGSSSLTITNANIMNCHIDEDGGAILVSGDPNAVLEICDSYFSSNSALNGGVVKNENGTLIIKESTLTSNSVKGNGGAVYNNSSCTIRDSEILLNQATGTNPSGNAIYNAGILTFFNNVIDGNSSSEAPEALNIALTGRVYNSSQGEWKRFNVPSAELSSVENRSSAENIYRNQGITEGSQIRFAQTKTPQGTLTLIPVQGEEAYTVSPKLDYTTAHEFYNGQLVITVPNGFEITDDASVIINTVASPASDFSPQQQLITISHLMLDEGSTITLLLKEQEVPPAYTAARTITKAYTFIVTADADGDESAWSVSDDATAIFTSTGNSRNTDFHLACSGEEMYINLETEPATAIKVITGKTPAEITSRLSSIDGETQGYTIFNTSGEIGENTPITADATLTVTPPKGVLFKKDFTIHVNENLFVRLEERDGSVSWQNSIQDAVNNGSEGATITLWEGIYMESVDMGNNNYQLLSTDPSSDTVRDNTIITGVSGPAITINGGQDNRTVIMGLHIKNNTTGSGIRIGNANPIIKENRIALNQAQKGSGIMIDTAEPSSQRTGDITIVENNLIENNVADYGGGIYVETGRNPKIVENEIKANTANANGGGVYVAEGGTVQNSNGIKWQAHQLPGTTDDAEEVEGTEDTNTYTLNKVNGSATADNSQIYYTRTDTSHLTKWIAHDKLNCIRLYGTFSAGDIMRLFDSVSALTEIASTVYSSGDYMNIDRDVISSSNYYVSLQDEATEIYAQSSKRRAAVVNTPTSAPALLSPKNNAVELIKPVTLKWDSHTGDASYKIYYGMNSNNLDQIKSCQGTEYKLNSLDTNTTYYWKVEAVDQYGATLSSTTRNFKTLPFEGGRGTAFIPYQVKTAAQLNTVRDYPSCYFIQTADINLSAYSNWDPIDPFTGEYNGQDHVISNLKINSSNNNLGLFGGTSGAKLQGIILTNIDIMGAGYLTYPVNCGGLVGMATSTTITDCHTSGTINTTNHDNVGGLVGYCYSLSSTAEITLSHSDCTVTGRYDVGGLVGDFHNEVSIERCFATGNATAKGSVGGLIGLYQSAGKVENAYARGDVEATNSGQIGGLIGRINNGDGFSDCYSTGKITSTSSNYTGGFVGRYFEAEINGCYWDKKTSGMDTSAAGSGRNTGDMKNKTNFSGWDFDYIWAIDSKNDGYPYLKNNQP